MSASEPDLSQTVLGRHRLLRRLGEGGMGSVYLAQHELLSRQVAIKVLHPSLAARPNARKRFLREARAASKVKHPGVVEIHDVALEGAHVYFVMDLLEGQDLGERLEHEGRLPWSRALGILVQVARAVQAAHAVGVVHRDIKPDNCFLVAQPDGSERVKVVDFGIAKVTSEEPPTTDELTAAGEIFGTLGYMAPEMAQGPGSDPRSDIYALGVMMFRMLTGRLPFVGTPVEVLAQHLNKRPPSPRGLEPSIPAEVERIVLRMLEKEPGDRYSSMGEVVAALELALGSIATSGTSAEASSLRSRPLPVAEVVDLDQRPGAPLPSTAEPWQASPAKTTAYGEDPALPPLPDDAAPAPSRFRPPAELGLAIEPVKRPPDPVRSEDQPAARTRGWLVTLAVVAALAAAGAAAWSHRDPLAQAVEDVAGSSEAASPPASTPATEPVLLLIDTVPRDATVFIDDVPILERPVKVPRSEQHLRVRVEASGYEPRTIQVQPLRTRKLEVKLDRAKRPP